MARRIILAGGGTAGHIEPALAVADSLRKIDSKLELEFLGTSSGLEQLLVPQRGYLLRTIPKVVLPRKISLAAILFPLKLIGGVFKARKIVKGADLLIGFGGYVSATAYLAARLAGVSIALHEANARPGWANRLGRHFAKVVAVNFENVRSDWSGSILTGMPIRKAITEVAHLSETERKKFRELHATTWGFDSSRPIVAIFGGSQGSLQINEAVASYLKNSDRDIQILHAVGSNNPLQPAAPNYLPMAYFHDMASVYGAADLMITRSGAVTCSELMTVARFALLVPLAHGNGEQSENARELVDQGRALLVSNQEFNGDWLVKNLKQVVELARSKRLEASKLHLHAADRIAELALGANS
ncbi:MAG: UDP-N-acetylglucosamine--N-acetylmuramyl-(pentapeptide) pyrophosphoryl-undecaprenol N-acetylglucosamine transferase [Actinomycetota bacterium]